MGVGYSAAPAPAFIRPAALLAGVSVEGIADPYKLSANENPLGASPRLWRRWPICRLWRFILMVARALRDKLAALNGIEADRICSNGSDDILQLLAQAYLAPGDNMLHSALSDLLASRAAG